MHMFLSHLPLLKLFLNHNNYWPEQITVSGVQMTQKTVAITIQNHRSLWNSSNPEEGVYLLILNMKQQSFHLHAPTSCSSPSIHPHTTNSCSQSPCPCASYSCHLLLHPHTSSSCSPFFHLQTLWQLQILSTYSPSSVAACITFSLSIHLLLRIAHTLKHSAYMAPHAV